MKILFYICILFSTSIALEKKEFVIDGKVSLEGLWAEFEELFEPGAPGSLRPGLYACSGWCRWVTILKGPNHLRNQRLHRQKIGSSTLVH
ncbi:unnamed protein product, partial [Mesorhabditis belari]|uniref:Uncharacterized protein n=1 Tax=Mesorhabditis belari TaxID=2138241 RepID=A0AAF3ECZ0_9BILA